MNKNTFDESVLNLSANEKLTNVNNFVFTNNQEFINFQMRFTDIVRADGNSLDLGKKSKGRFFWSVEGWGALYI